MSLADSDMTVNVQRTETLGRGIADAGSRRPGQLVAVANNEIAQVRKSTTWLTARCPTSSPTPSLIRFRIRLDR